MFTATTLLLSLLAAPFGSPQGGPQARAPQTDQTVTVSRGSRLRVENFAGEVIIKTWDRDQLRVIAHHGSRTKVDVRTVQTGVTVRSSTTGAPGSVDYEITAPSWMPIAVEGTFNFVTVEGSQAEVSVETVRGDVVIRGGTGTISAKSIEGEVSVDGARGRVTASSVNQGIKISNTSGDINAETHNGSVSLTKVTSANAEVATINGHITFDGPIADKGRYRLTTHNGHVTLGIPDTSNVTFIVRTYQGQFSSQIELVGPPRDEAKRGKRLTYTLGNGSAEMEIESFGGSIRIRRQGGAMPPGKDKEKDKDKDKS
jgi:DUF4097 and DUF4098 domain-containing protein YvlB